MTLTRTLTRTLALSFAVVAMLVAPVLQHSADAQGRGAGREAAGQRRGGRAAPAPRPGNRAAAGPRRVVVAPRRGGVVIGAYYRPLYFSPFYSPFYGSFYSPFYSPFYDPFPYRYGGYSGYGYSQFYGPESSLRLQVSPRNTEVFVDGYYAGTVDDFDGVFQRLRLEPGEHDVTLYLPGHRTLTQQILLQPNRTFRVTHTMVPLAANDTPDPRPVPADPRPSREPAAPAVSGGEVDSDASFGAVAIRVQPADADVLVDGEQWEGPADNEALVLQVAPGPHRIEVRRDGYRGYTAQIDVRAGQTTPINVSLPRQ